MHFSRPSGQRLSWWCPWNRGAVGRFSSGYITVSTFLNISRKVTPNPLTGLRKSRTGTGDLLRHIGQAERRAAKRRLTQVEAVIMRQVQRRHREALDGAVPAVLDWRRLRPDLGGVPLARVVPERDQQQDQHDDQAGARVDDVRVSIVPPRLDRRDQQDP